MSNSSNYPAPPVLNCEQRQIMLGLAYLAYTGEGITTPAPEAQIKQEITTALPLVTYTPPGGTTANLGNWKIVWGPVAYTVPGSSMQDNLMYVVQNGTTPQYAIAIRGTNFTSEVDWLLEDFNVISTMNWPINATTSSPTGAMINESASIDMNILLSMVDTVTTNKTLQAYLMTQTTSAINICVTGHSLGGMLSSTLALNLLETQQDNTIWDASGESTVCFVSFAGPTAGNNVFAAHSNSVFANATRPSADYWDPNMTTNGDVIACSYDIAPLAYTGTNIYNFQTGSAGAMFSVYQDDINFSNLTFGEKEEWHLFQEYILSKLGGLTTFQQYTPLALANNLSAIQGIFNGTPPPASSGKFSDYLTAFMLQAAWQHSSSYPNIFGMTDTLLSKTIVNRNLPVALLNVISLSSIVSNPSEIKRDHTVALTLTGSGFSSFVSPRMIPTKHLSFSDFLCVNDTTITVTMEVLSLADDIENIGVEGYIGVGQIASTQKLPLTIHFF